MTADEMAELIVLRRFLVLPRDVVFDIIDANKREEPFAPDPRGLKRIWKDMKRSQKGLLFEDYDRSSDEFGPERQALACCRFRGRAVKLIPPAARTRSG